MKLLLLCAALLVFLYCAGVKKKSGQIEATTPDLTKYTDDTLYALRVSFISKGSGTDWKSKQAFEQLIKQFEHNNHITIPFEKTRWGREGEVDYCIKSISTNITFHEEFIFKTKDLLKENPLVRIYEQVPCKHKK